MTLQYPARYDFVAGHNLVQNSEMHIRKSKMGHGNELFVAVELPVGAKDLIHDGKLSFVVDFFEIAADGRRDVGVWQPGAQLLEEAELIVVGPHLYDLALREFEDLETAYRDWFARRRHVSVGTRVGAAQRSAHGDLLPGSETILDGEREIRNTCAQAGQESLDRCRAGAAREAWPENRIGVVQVAAVDGGVPALDDGLVGGLAVSHV